MVALLQQIEQEQTAVDEAPLPKIYSPTEQRLLDMGLVDIEEYDSRLTVELAYATPDNFTGDVLYDDINNAFLLPEAAAKLSAAQDFIDSLHSGLRLIIYDAARPMSVQRKMREIAVKAGKGYYVANPANGGGLHNYGAAVDVSLLDASGVPLDMGTAYDFFGPEANIDREDELLNSGKITRKQLDNRILLREAMRHAGFTTVASEWWHFNHCSRKTAMEKYKLIDF